jgi:hypothetical protein
VSLAGCTLLMLSGGENAGIKFDEFADKYGQEGVFEMVLVACAKVVANFWEVVCSIGGGCVFFSRSVSRESLWVLLGKDGSKYSKQTL